MQINTTWHDHFVKVNERVKNSDVYKSIVINEFTQKTEPIS